MPDIQITLAETEADFDEARRLMIGFRAFFQERLAPITHVVDRYYPPAEWDGMLRDLPKLHARPEGAILLARIDGAAMGCCMLRPIEGAAEMKRMYVDPAARGAGLARALVRAACGQAKADGYRILRLDTSYLQVEAQGLYTAEGFARRGPYYDCPEDVERILVFFEKTL